MRCGLSGHRFVEGRGDGSGQDEVGSRINQTIQTTLAGGVEVIALHHQRKRAQGAAKPTKLEDLYGSVWIQAGVGSVVLLWGEPGDLVVELSHLKQPAGQVGPLKLLHDHETGTTAVFESTDVLALLERAANGLTAVEAARALFEDADPSRKKIEQARRRLQSLTKQGLAYERKGESGGDWGGEPTRWYRTSRLEEVS